MKACEHFLPCGYCNKYDVPCKATAERIIDYNCLIGEIDLETAEEMKAVNKCKHEWRYKGQNSFGHNYECIKCNTMKVVPLESLSSTDKECDHEWKSFFIIDKGGYEHREEYRCSKCGAIKT